MSATGRSKSLYLITLVICSHHHHPDFLWKPFSILPSHKDTAFIGLMTNNFLDTADLEHKNIISGKSFPSLSAPNADSCVRGNPSLSLSLFFSHFHLDLLTRIFRGIGAKK